ncbi:MAG: hypothetical protein V4531_11375 [Actinomycetota bacterium]
MTDENVPPTPPSTPPPPYTPPPVAPPAPPAPAYAAPNAYAAPASGPKQTLSLTSFILGIAGLVFSWIPVLGFLASLAAIIIGFIARKREPGAPKWMSLVGIILGFVAIVIGIIVIVILIATIALSANSYNNY